MGWLSKIFKGSSHKTSEGQYDWNERYVEDTVGIGTSSSGGAWTEIEDIDKAIALSLSEDDQKRKPKIDNEYQLKEDEQLAKAIQASLNIESPPRYGNGHIYQPMPLPYSVGLRVCAGCNREIGYGRFLNCIGGVWHPECFRCHACKHPISDYEFSISGSYPYHKSCYKDKHHPKCDVCKQFISTNAAGLIEYRAHPFWVQKYCPTHEHDGTPRCCSCERMEPRDTTYVALNDGRKLCLECLDSVIMDTNQCQPLYLDIQNFYESLDMKVEQQVPLLLVERQALNEAMDGEKHGHHHMPETRGLCLSEEQTVSTIRKRPKIGTGNKVMGMITEPFKLTRRCDVTAILVLYGLPRLLTGSILAHEMMHAWLRLKGYRTLSQDVEEGICQVLAHFWLQSQLKSLSSDVASTSSNQRGRSPFEKKLGEFFKHQIEVDTSLVYGNGFRAGNQAVMKYGLRTTLDHIWMTGNFPY
ncbi:protein DA1-like [Impatiens glandulifera]|uniref:protein DA1-like n=1 Tax=Impatiens glandulifera TaxID=253017 RepID=UPI001FB0F22F|nr:protein DA1-like [Impatiens glandulifera]